MNHSNALSLYHAAGAPPYPNVTLLALLDAASEMAVETLAVTTTVASADAEAAEDGWVLTVVLPPYAVALLSFNVTATAASEAALLG